MDEPVDNDAGSRHDATRDSGDDAESAGGATTSRTKTATLMQPRRRRWVRWVGFGVLGLLLVVFASPYLFNIPPVRRAVLAVASVGLDGRVRIEQSSLGWFSPVSLRNVVVEPDAGPPLIQVPTVQGDVPLWRYAVASSQLGTLRVEEPLIRVELYEGGSNFTRMFAPVEGDEPDPEVAKAATEQAIARLARFHVRVEVTRGKLVYTGRESTREWTVADFSATFGLRPVEVRATLRPEFWIDQGIVLERLSITPEMCNDALKYVAPVLSGVAEVDGEFSLEIDDCQVPLGLPEAGTLEGRFVIDHVDVGSAGPVIRRLSAALNLEANIELARDSIVSFHLEDGRVHHEGLKFRLPGVQIETSGSVGIDQTLDLLAEIQLPLDQIHDGPLLRTISKQRLVIPIRGTLAQPEVDGAALGDSTVQLLLASAQEILGDDSLTLDTLLERLTERGLFEGSEIGNGQLLERYFERRAAGEGPFGGRLFRPRNSGREAGPANGENGAAAEPGDDDNAAATEPRRLRLFPRLRRRSTVDPDAVQ